MQLIITETDLLDEALCTAIAGFLTRAPHAEVLNTSYHVLQGCVGPLTVTSVESGNVGTTVTITPAQSGSISVGDTVTVGASFTPAELAEQAAIANGVDVPLEGLVALSPTLADAQAAGFTAQVPPPAPTPSAAVPPPPPPAAPPTLDAAGLPWDSRIHASTRALLNDGTWRAKRGVSDELVASVVAELRALMSAGVSAVPAVSNAQPWPFAVPPAPGQVQVPPPPVAAPIPVPEQPVSTVQAPVPPAPAPVAGDAFPAFIERWTQAVLAGHLTHTQLAEEVAAVGRAVGLPTLTVPQLELRADLMAQVDARLTEMTS